MLMTAGERISMALLAMCLDEEGVPAISFTGSQTGIVTTSDHTEARILEIRPQRAVAALEQGRVVIIAGFQGVSREREVTTLGRGGSDTSAVALAAALGAEYCEILTDVDGLHTADPRLVPSARTIPECSYEEALEMASLGAKMQGRSIDLARRYRVAVRIGTSAAADSSGTWIRGNGEKAMEKSRIVGVATEDGYSFLETGARLDRLARISDTCRAGLRFFQQSEAGTSLAVQSDRMSALCQALDREGITYRERQGMAIASVVGEGLVSSSDLLPRFLDALAAAGAEPVLICCNSFSLTAVITSELQAPAARALHDRLIPSPGKPA